ncbi:MAG: hypothetical protein DRH12_13835 [Deltaproteobacteria bacterium]|nr:MAG: hypothetical protein DRH12_13835 [Deltaproteobacteria bacterium]
MTEYTPHQGIRATSAHGNDEHTSKIARTAKNLIENCKILAENINDGAYFLDTNGRFLYVNKIFAKTLGLPQECFLGKHGFELVPEEYRAVERERIARFLSGEALPPHEIQYTSKGKKKRWVQVNSRPVFVDGQLVGILGIARDISRRKDLELLLEQSREELEKRVKDRTAQLNRVNKELLEHQKQLQALASELSLAEESIRRQAAAELHDSVAQTLAFAKIKTDLLRKKIKDPELLKSTDEIKALIEEGIKSTRGIISELSPPILYEIGLVAAIKWLAKRLEQRNGVKVKVTGKAEPKSLGLEVKVLLFQVIKELLANIAKHAETDIALVSFKREKGKFRVDVIDEGVGFEVSKSHFYGITTIAFGLFSIRVRVQAMGGMFRVRSEPGYGTKAVIIVPLNQSKNS